MNRDWKDHPATSNVADMHPIPEISPVVPSLRYPPRKRQYSVTLHIGFLLFPKVQQLDLTGPYEVFASLPDTCMHLVASTMEPVISATGLVTFLKVTGTSLGLRGSRRRQLHLPRKVAIAIGLTVTM